MTLNNRIAVVTGASRGIGAAIAQELGQWHAVVIGTATTATGAAAIGKALEDANITGSGAVLDVADPDSVDAFVARITKQFGAPAILVNNAGIARDNLLMRMQEDDWNTVLNTNLSSVFRLSKACLKAMMKARFGRIINIASVVGVTGNPGQANYCAAKAGILGFTKSLAREVASRAITVNAVAPGFIDTDMTRSLSAEQRAQILSQVPAGRLGTPREIACAVTFLASEHAAYINGETLHVNGGMFMA